MAEYLGGIIDFAPALQVCEINDHVIRLSFLWGFAYGKTYTFALENSNTENTARRIPKSFRVSLPRRLRRYFTAIRYR
jgi:hypothetical protein